MNRRLPLRRLAWSLVLATGISRAASAQVVVPKPAGPGTLSGLVVDSAGRPVPEATVYIVNPRRTVLSRANGTFRFDSVPEGRYTIGARAIGYVSSATGGVVVGPGGAAAIIEMVRFAIELPSMTTLARRGGLSGVIGDTSYRAMAGVTVRVLGSGAGSATTDSVGEFFLPVKPGRYMVRLELPGYRRQLVAVTVPADEGRRIAAWLAPKSGKENPIVGKNLFELEQRLIRRTSVNSRLYTNEDLVNLGIDNALVAAERFAARRLSDDACALINGGPEDAPLWTISAEEIELMETYVPKAPRVRTTSINGNTTMVDRGDVSVPRCGHVVWLRK